MGRSALNDTGLTYSQAVVFNAFVTSRAWTEKAAISLKHVAKDTGVQATRVVRALGVLKENGKLVHRTDAGLYWIEALHHSGLMKEEVPEKEKREKAPKTPTTEAPAGTTNGRRHRRPYRKAETFHADAIVDGGLVPATLEATVAHKDPEAFALLACAGLLLPLDPIAQRRVLDYLAHRFVTAGEAA